VENSHQPAASAVAEENASPTISVIMPIRNEAAYIERSLRAVLNQDYPRELVEVVIADGMSSDDTRERIRRIQQEHANVRIIDNVGRIAPTGLNAAIAASTGEIIFRIDGHCEIAPDYIQHCVAHLASGKADCVGGPIETVGETTCARAIAAAMSSNFGVGGAAFRTVSDRTMLTDTVAFPAMPRQVFERAGRFDEELIRNQDDEYSFRLADVGARILLAADVRSRYYSRGTLKSLWRQYFQYGLYKVRVLQKHPNRARARHFVPAIFVLSLALSGAMAAAGIPWPLYTIAALYAVANLGASLITVSKNGWLLLQYLPFVFFVLHFSYGIGFWSGLVKFWNQWTTPRTA
jgi:succinoglycan biosynthesis protein ExoA